MSVTSFRTVSGVAAVRASRGRWAGTRQDEQAHRRPRITRKQACESGGAPTFMPATSGASSDAAAIQQRAC
jgi:hypothetical protein